MRNKGIRVGIILCSLAAEVNPTRGYGKGDGRDMPVPPPATNERYQAFCGERIDHSAKRAAAT